MPADQAGEIAETYRFLRRLIDALRVVRGHAKDLTVPDVASLQSRYLAQRLGFQSSEQLHETIVGRTDMAKSVWG